uniref:Uncharacterized protein n=1 Tax=Anguilla anguilla TaxID=7936 RepID=A0A0E9USB5_ANGAN
MPLLKEKTLDKVEQSRGTLCFIYVGGVSLVQWLGNWGLNLRGHRVTVTV